MPEILEKIIQLDGKNFSFFIVKLFVDNVKTVDDYEEFLRFFGFKNKLSFLKYFTIFEQNFNYDDVEHYLYFRATNKIINTEIFDEMFFSNLNIDLNLHKNLII